MYLSRTIRCSAIDTLPGRAEQPRNDRSALSQSMPLVANSAVEWPAIPICGRFPADGERCRFVAGRHLRVSGTFRRGSSSSPDGPLFLLLSKNSYLIDFIDTKNGALTVPFRGFSCLLRDSAPATGGAESKSVPLLEPTVRSRPGNLYALVCSRVALGNQTNRSCGQPSSGIT